MKLALIVKGFSPGPLWAGVRRRPMFSPARNFRGLLWQGFDGACLCGRSSSGVKNSHALLIRSPDKKKARRFLGVGTVAEYGACPIFWHQKGGFS